MFYAYVIRSKKDSKWYTGSTNDLRKRFKDHNDGKVFSTKGRGPFDLIYYEACVNERDARLREKYLKSGMGKRYLKNRLKRFLSLTGFTLIELILVTLIIVILVGVSTPLFRRTFNNIQLGETTYNIVKFMNYARARAISERINTKLNIDFDKKVYWLTVNTDPELPDEFSRIEGRLGRLYPIPLGIEIEGEGSSLIFYPNGRSEDFTLTIKNKDGTAKAIEVKKETGEAQILENEE